MLETVQITKLVHGGQGLGTLEDGRKVFVWNALPGETVGVRLTKTRRDYAEGIAQEILQPSVDRVTPSDEAYLSTSPWQVIKFAAENVYKKEILKEAFQREDIPLPDFEFKAPKNDLHYRNKMEYSFWGDDLGLHLALFHRASHDKQIVEGSSIARPEIDETARKIVAVLNKNGVRASQLKTVVVRTNKSGDAVAALFTKDEAFPLLDELQNICQGVVVYYSNPKSPVSVATKHLYQFGKVILQDTILGVTLKYDVNSFFQVNLGVFEDALKAIKHAAVGQGHILDMYAGVGTIGLVVGAHRLIELDSHNVEMAQLNAQDTAEIVHASAEMALEYITKDETVIFDPPRAGLHNKVIDHVLSVKPQKIVYLSCNPSTQARDVAKLQSEYTVSSFTGYNFFPRTPHIESLAILTKNV